MNPFTFPVDAPAMPASTNEKSLRSFKPLQKMKKMILSITVYVTSLFCEVSVQCIQNQGLPHNLTNEDSGVACQQDSHHSQASESILDRLTTSTARSNCN